jgi:hypothetical protein
MAPGRLPHAHSFVPFVQSCAAGPAANAGCMLAAATMNNDAKTIFFIRPSVPANRLVRAAFCHTPQTKTLTLRFYDTRRGHGNTPEVANETGIVIQSSSGYR